MILVRYKVKDGRAEENEALVRDVFAALERERPEGVRYATFKLEDGRSFLHVARIEVNDGKNPLLALDAFRRFAAAVRDRCEEPPVTIQMELVASYRMLAPA